MARLVLKTKILNKEEQRRLIMQTLLETRNTLNSSSSVKENLKDELFKWLKNTSEDWKYSETLKSKTCEALKYSQFVRIVITTVLFLYLLEICRTQNIAFLILGFSLYVMFFLMNIASSAFFFYGIAPGEYASLLNHIDDIQFMLMNFSQRLGVVKRKFQTDISHTDFSVHGIYREQNNYQFKKNISLFSLYNFYGIPIAFSIFSLFYYTQIELFIYLESFVFYFAVIFALVKDVNINFSIMQIKRRYEHMRAVTRDFKLLFEKKQKLKDALEDFDLIHDVNSLYYSSRSSLLKQDRQLNFVIFAIMCEPILNLNLSIDKMEKLVLYLVYGKFYESGILKDNSISNIIKIQTSSSVPSRNFPQTKILSNQKKVRNGNVKECENKRKSNSATQKINIISPEIIIEDGVSKYTSVNDEISTKSPKSKFLHEACLSDCLINNSTINAITESANCSTSECSIAEHSHEMYAVAKGKENTETHLTELAEKSIKSEPKTMECSTINDGAEMSKNPIIDNTAESFESFTESAEHKEKEAHFSTQEKNEKKQPFLSAYETEIPSFPSEKSSLVNFDNETEQDETDCNADFKEWEDPYLVSEKISTNKENLIKDDSHEVKLGSLLRDIEESTIGISCSQCAGGEALRTNTKWNKTECNAGYKENNGHCTVGHEKISINENNFNEGDTYEVDISSGVRETTNNLMDLNEMKGTGVKPASSVKEKDDDVFLTTNSCSENEEYINLRNKTDVNLQEQVSYAYASDHNHNKRLGEENQNEVPQCLPKDNSGSSLNHESTTDILNDAESCKIKEQNTEKELNEQNYESFCGTLNDTDGESQSPYLSNFCQTSPDDRHLQEEDTLCISDTSFADTGENTSDILTDIKTSKIKERIAVKELSEQNYESLYRILNDTDAESLSSYLANLCQTLSLDDRNLQEEDTLFTCASHTHHDESTGFENFASSGNTSSEEPTVLKKDFNYEEIIKSTGFETANWSHFAREKDFPRVCDLNHFNENSNIFNHDSPREILHLINTCKSDKTTNGVESNIDSKQNLSSEIPETKISEEQNMFENLISSEKCLDSSEPHSTRRIVKGRRRGVRNVTNTSQKEKSKENGNLMSVKGFSNCSALSSHRKVIRGRRNTHQTKMMNVNPLFEEHKASYQEVSGESNCKGLNETSESSKSNFLSLNETKAVIEEPCCINTTEGLMPRKNSNSSNKEEQFSSVNGAKVLLAEQCPLTITEGLTSSANPSSSEDQAYRSGETLHLSTGDIMIIPKLNDKEILFRIGKYNASTSQKHHSLKKRIDPISESDDEFYVNENIRGSFKTSLTVCCLSTYRKSKLCKIYNRDKNIMKTPEKKENDSCKYLVQKIHLDNKADTYNKALFEGKGESVPQMDLNNSERSIDATKCQYGESLPNLMHQNSKLREMIEDESAYSSSCWEGRSDGTSEDLNFRFHNSTSPNDSESWSTNYQESNLGTNYQESGNDDNSDYKLEVKDFISGNFDAASSQHWDPDHISSEFSKYDHSSTTNYKIPIKESNNSQASFPDESKKTTWNSNLCMDNCVNINQLDEEITNYEIDGQEAYHLNDCEERNEPIKYTLRHENLDLDVVDTASCITLRLVSDKDHINSLPPKWVSKTGTLVTPVHQSEDDVVLLPSVESSSYFSDTPFIKISKNDITMSAESTKINHSSTNSSTKETALDAVDDSQLYNTTIGSANNEMGSATQDNKPDISGTELSTGCNLIQETLKASDISSTSHDTDSYSVDSIGGKENLEECMAIVNPEDKDFHFETENLKLNYKPNPGSGSIQVSFRKRKGTTKLVFKSEEKKLYLKTTPLK